MAHPRAAILAAVRSALAGATSPSLPVFEFEQAAANAPCWEVADLVEELDEAQTTKTRYSRYITLAVAAIAKTRAQRDTMSEALESVLLGRGTVGGFEMEFESVALTPPEGAGERLHPAVYTLRVQYFTTRN